MPIACTLQPDAIPDRLDDWRAALGSSRGRTPRPGGGVRITLDDDVDIESITRLVVAEQRCCSFLRFAITVDGRGIALEIDAPANAADVVAAMFGDSRG